MGRELFCDLCRVSVPIEENLQTVEIGGAKIAELCLTDAQKLIQGIKQQVIDAQKQVKEAMQPPKPAEGQPLPKLQPHPEGQPGKTDPYEKSNEGPIPPGPG